MVVTSLWFLSLAALTPNLGSPPPSRYAYLISGSTPLTLHIYCLRSRHIVASLLQFIQPSTAISTSMALVIQSNASILFINLSISYYLAPQKAVHFHFHSYFRLGTMTSVQQSYFQFLLSYAFLSSLELPVLHNKVYEGGGVLLV